MPDKILGRISSFFTVSLTWMVAVFFSSAAVLYLVQVFFRIFFRDLMSSLGWLDPLIQYLFVLSALMGAAYGVRTNENIKIELFRKLAEKRPVKVLLNCTAFLVTAVIVWAFYSHFRTELTQGNASHFKVATWILDLPYIFLFLASLFYYLVNTIKAFRGEEI